jgi:N-acetylneuraminic acid mutarotase
VWQRQHISSGPSPPPRSGHCACALGDKSMFVFGGNTTQVSFNDLWELSISTSTWSQVRVSSGVSPSGRVGHTLTALGSRLLLLGGREYATNHFDPFLHSFNIRSKTWSAVPLRGGNSVRTGHCATVHAGRLLVFGGLNDEAHLLDDLTSVALIT